MVLAKQLYQEGFAKWRAVIDKFPLIMDDEQTMGGDILDFVKAYRRVLDQFDERLGEDFPLWDLIDEFDRESQFTEELAAHRKRKGLPPAATNAAPSKPAPTAKTALPKDSKKESAPKTPAKTPADSTKK